MATQPVESLMKRGKRPVAKYIKDECSSSGSGKSLLELLDYLLDPKKVLDDFDRMDWLKWVIAGGTTFDEFEKEVRRYDNAVTCGLVWTSNFVAYRCRTCGISPCMSLCADCFQAGNHVGHDFNMFRSQAGGACDCGDINVMNENGFCPRHGPNQARMPSAPPADLLTVAEAIMPRILLRLVQHLRENAVNGDVANRHDSHLLAITAGEKFLIFLHSLSDMGAAMRKVITKALTNPQQYHQLLNPAFSKSKDIIYMDRLKANYEAALEHLDAPDIPDAFIGVKGLRTPLKHSCFLEELVFWTVKYEFPQTIVTFLLSLLSDDDYKTAFTRVFIQHYSRISMALLYSVDRQTISNRVVHISVQLLSPEALARMMVEEHRLLYLMLMSLDHMVMSILTSSDMNDLKQNYPMVVDCSKDILKGHCYWPIISDLINVLSHKSVAYYFMRDENLLKEWFKLVSCFQGMNLNHRELGQHVEYEPDTYYSAFSAELEICASPMWSLLVHCKDHTTQEYTIAVIKNVINSLHHWFDKINTRPFSRPNPFQVSFHLPLHRYFAVFLCQAVRSQQLSLCDLLPGHDFLQMLMTHPLQLQVAFHEIFSGMWVRNGMQIKGQAMTYIQCHFCNSMVDADLYILQVCATKLDPDDFVKTVLDRFHLQDIVSVKQSSRHDLTFLDPEHEMHMLEGALALLTMLVTFRNNLGMTDLEVTQLEMLSLLCMAERTHSQLMDLMPERCGLSGQTKDFEPTLRQVSDYREPNFEAGGTMQQGMYVPKDFIWELHYDPMHVMLRAMHRKDFQQSMDRYTSYVKNNGLYKGSGTPWPPFRLPGPTDAAYASVRRILHCRTMHGLIFTLLYKALNEVRVSEAVLYHAIYLLEMAISLPATTAKTRVNHTFGCLRDKHFLEWFASDCILTNMRTVIEELQSLEEVDDIAEPDPPASASKAITYFREDDFPASASTSGSSFYVETPPSPADDLQEDLIKAINSMQCDMPQEPPGVKSQGVSTDLPHAYMNVNFPVNESIVTLLLKLHSKLSHKENSYLPESFRAAPSSALPAGDSRIGDGPFFIGKVLDKACRSCTAIAKQVEDHYKRQVEMSASKKVDQKSKSPLDKEERRRRAQERQKKLMQQFATKQKEFMEKIIGDEIDEDENMQEEEVKPSPTERLYDCCICYESTPSTEERLVGLVVLLQPTSVLGHRRWSNEQPTVPVSDRKHSPKPVSCATEAEKRLHLLLNHYGEASALLSVNIGWEGGVHAQTCGHYVHLDCHDSYMKSLVSQQLQKGEYRCPICRQLANTTIPICPDEGAALSELLPLDTRELILSIAKSLDNQVISRGSQRLTRAMGNVMEDLTNITYPKYIFATKSQSAECVVLFICSVARINLELEILQQGGSPCLPLTNNKRSGFVSLLQVLRLHSKMMTSRNYSSVWSHLSGVPLPSETDSSLQVWKDEVPMLLRDPCALLIQLVLNMPHTMSKVELSHIIQVLYNLTFVQALCVMSCKFTEEERIAWRSQAKEIQSLGGILGHTIQYLDATGLLDDGSAVDPFVPAICQSVWSPQSVESTVQQICLPFLRLSALLQHHMFGPDLPVISSLDVELEFCTLCNYMGMTPAVAAAGPSTSQGPSLNFSCAEAVRWYSDNPKQLLLNWSQHLGQLGAKNPDAARILLTHDVVWKSPLLQNLPHQYDQLFQYYRRKSCPNCNSVPSNPAICLVCSQIVCFKGTCCRLGQIWECIQHSIDCGSGTGMFLLINSSCTAVIRGHRATIWGSVYLDEHGEEDRDLKRGKPLYLSQARYNLLQQQWISHNFDHVCKRWVFHQNNL